MTILNNFTSSFGADAVAAMGITQKINQVPMQIAMGLSQGIMPLISYNYSSGNHKRMRGTLSFTVKISQGFLCAVAVLYFVFAGPLTRMFMDNEVIVGYGIKFLRGFCLGMPFFCLLYTSNSICHRRNRTVNFFPNNYHGIANLLLKIF